MLHNGTHAVPRRRGGRGIIAGSTMGNTQKGSSEQNMSMPRHFPPEALALLRALGERLGPEERLITCGFPGDPGKVEPSAWRPRPWGQESRGWSFPTGWNAYVTVGAFGKAEDGTFRRRAALSTGGMAFMIDDVGTKVDRAAVAHYPPSARVLTSPGNEQWWYILSAPERDLTRFDALIRAFIAGPLKGQDPGMASVTRVGRLPGFTNGKPAYGGRFDTLLEELNDRRFTLDEIVAGFGLQLIGRREPMRRLIAQDAEERIAAHFAVRGFLRDAGMLKRDDPDRAGWTEMTCPWVSAHTGAADNGAAIREPELDNGFFGGFRCHHGGCGGRGWRELTDWVAEEAAERMQQINEAAE